MKGNIQLSTGVQGGPAPAEAAEQREEAAGWIFKETERTRARPPAAVCSRVTLPFTFLHSFKTLIGRMISSLHISLQLPWLRLQEQPVLHSERGGVVPCCSCGRGLQPAAPQPALLPGP